ncbi:hypothetical protein FACS189463_0780 [Bacteroidia bacterium]|nr:hypothetical protein FACS189463_0780 [Bacteroidia bacterium]
MQYNLYFACSILKTGKGDMICFSINKAFVPNANGAKLADKVNTAQRKNSRIKKFPFSEPEFINCR